MPRKPDAELAILVGKVVDGTSTEAGKARLKKLAAAVLGRWGTLFSVLY